MKKGMATPIRIGHAKSASTSFQQADPIRLLFREAERFCPVVIGWALFIQDRCAKWFQGLKAYDVYPTEGAGKNAAVA